MRQHQTCRSSSNDANLGSHGIRHGSSLSCRNNAQRGTIVQGCKPKNCTWRSLPARSAQPTASIVARSGDAYAWRKSKRTLFIPGEVVMRRIPLLAGLSLFAFAVLPIAAAPAQGVALSGQVSSTEEGVME